MKSTDYSVQAVLARAGRPYEPRGFKYAGQHWKGQA